MVLEQRSKDLVGIGAEKQESGRYWSRLIDNYLVGAGAGGRSGLGLSSNLGR